MRADLYGELKSNWGWMLALGILMIILGILGLGMTFLLTLASVMVFGVFCLVGGGFQLFAAFKSKGWKSVTWHLLMGLAYLVAGFVMIWDPLGSSIWLTLILAAMFVATGTMRIIIAFQLRPEKAWGWVLFSGIVSILLGIMIFMQWPASGLWFIGMYVAIELIMQGWSAVTIAFAARAATRDLLDHGDKATA